MKTYTRADFIKLPAMTIFSRIDKKNYEIMYGLFCKTTDSLDYTNDWGEQDLISEIGFPGSITSGCEAMEYQMNLRDTFQDFEMDLDCTGRDGMFDDSDRFVVWDKKDVTKLRDYLNKVLDTK